MVEDDDVVEEDEPRVGDAEVVGMRVGDPLRPAGHAVAEEADRAAEERRELLLAVDAQRAELGVEKAGRVGGLLVEAEAAARLEADEGVAAEVLAALDALEEEGLGVVGRERSERRQRRERVAGQLAHDRHDVVLLSQLVEVHRECHSASVIPSAARNPPRQGIPRCARDDTRAGRSHFA